MDLETLLVQSRQGKATAEQWQLALYQASLLVPQEVYLAMRDQDAMLNGQAHAADHYPMPLPVFTSQDELSRMPEFDSGAVRVSGQELLLYCCNTTLHINPGSDAGRWFSVDEVRQICGVVQQVEQRVISGNATLQLSAHPPLRDEIQTALCQCLSTHVIVRAAYIALLRESDDAPTTLIALVCDRPDESVIQQVGELAVSFMPDNQIIDVCMIDNQSTGIDHVITAHLTPFYQRRWGSFLREHQH